MRLLRFFYHPCRKMVALLALWSLRILALGWVGVLLIWLALHFLIVPRIDEFRPYLEQRASRLLQTPVFIGALVAQSNGLIPSLELRDVRVMDGQGREALRLPSVLAALSPRSLLGWGLEQLYIDAPQLDVRRSADGTVWVAGIALPKQVTDHSGAADWVFGQTELALRHGSVSWTDELRGAATLRLTDVDLVLRNSHRSHAMRLDATPPADWGGRFSVMGQFKQALFSGHPGRWQTWDGELFADFSHVELQALRNYADLGLKVSQGSGALRAWVDLQHGVVASVTADVAMRQVRTQLGAQLDELAFTEVSGRAGFNAVGDGQQYFTEALHFVTDDGLHWPGGNLRLGLWPAGSGRAAHGDVSADRLDLAALAEIASRLPIGPKAIAAVKDLGPTGLVERIEGSWQGDLPRPSTYTLRGSVRQLHLAARHTDEAHNPGIDKLDVDFDATQAAGRATLALKNGSVDLPGILEDPQVAVDALSAEVAWKIVGGLPSIQITKARFANSDAQGEAQIKWQAATAPSRGTLDLQLSLSRLLGTSVHRYLPVWIDPHVRTYVREAILGGTASKMKLKIKGKLDELPYKEAKQGEFSVIASVKDVVFDYVPATLVPKGKALWPALTNLSGEFAIDRATLSIRADHAKVAGLAGLQLSKSEGVISSLYRGATLAVSLQGQGPLADGVGFVNNSPVGVLIDQVLGRTQASGNADYKVKLALALLTPENIKLQGAVTLADNDLQISPDLPRLSHAQGQVLFSEAGFSLQGVQARALGGEVRLEGGLMGARAAANLALASSNPTTNLTTNLPSNAAAGKAGNQLLIQGNATAEGLRQAKELGVVANLAQYATGGANYSATLGIRLGQPELQITSNLVGLAVGLPAPFNKGAQAALPLRVDTKAERSATAPDTPALEQLQIEVGQLAYASVTRERAGSQGRVLHGAIGVGLAAGEVAVSPAEGIAANIHADTLDLDAWAEVLSKISAGTGAGVGVGVGGGTDGSSEPGTSSYIPNQVALRANTLVVEGRRLNRVVLGATRDNAVWRANLDALEMSGYAEYRPSIGATAGRVYARLARLALGPSTAQEVESLLDSNPASIPALDIEVEDFELRGKKLGRVEVEAVNLGMGTSAAGASARDPVREWRLNKFNIANAESTLTASGNWAKVVAADAPPATRSLRERRRTELNIKLDIADSGGLLTRFGMPGVVRNGKGKIEGQVAWLGSPLSLDAASLSGNLEVNVESGQFLKAEPGIAKLLGVLSLQSLPRRLALDFRDVFSEGFAFDSLRGDVAITQGIARTSNLQMRGVNAAVLMDGQADISKETQSIKVLVVPEINAGSASLLASTVNPLIGLGTFLAQLVLRGPLADANTQEFLIDGTWVDPKVSKVERRSAPPPAKAASAP